MEDILKSIYYVVADVYYVKIMIVIPRCCNKNAIEMFMLDHT